jgi:hypothetical protein
MTQLNLLVSNDEVSDGYSVLPISYQDSLPFILNIHYAKRKAPIKYPFGLFFGGELVGVVTYGVPPSHTLLKGVCGPEFASNVLELNRLVLLNNKKNEASMLVGRTLKMLGNRIIVSYADSVQEHVGYVYQAANFIYTGKTKPVKEIYLKSRPELHHTTHGRKTYAQMIEEHGDDVGFRYRSIKHRYVTFVGDRRFKKKAKAALRYPVMGYPKGSAESKDDNRKSSP